jgi:hypothetical protein
MAVDQHPSRKPSPPRKPPATSTTDGQANTVSKTRTGGADMEYGSRNGKDLRIAAPHKSERAHDFRDFGTHVDGSAPKAGKEQSNEGTVSKAKHPGDQKY